MKAVNTTFAYLRLCWHESDSWSVRLNSSSASPEAVSKKSLCHRTPAAFGVDIVAMHLDPSYARGIPWAEPALKTKLQNLYQPNQSCQLASANDEGTNRTELAKKWFQDSSTTATKEPAESWPQRSRKSKGKTWLCWTFGIVQACFTWDGRSKIHFAVESIQGL